MNLTGKSLIAGQWQGDTNQSSFQAFQPAHNNYAEEIFYNATATQVNQACEAAVVAFLSFRQTTASQRAELLITIASEIEALGEQLLEVTHKETNLPLARLQGERGRTVSQLRFFAQHLMELDETGDIELGDENRTPLPKPKTQLRYLPVGPVAVFGASNFPYAFSTAGGDSAAALAAGCPIVVKGHPAHPGTSELMARAISTALDKCQLPQGVFSQLQTAEPEAAHLLVSHAAIKAVGFTGSYAVASQLQQTIFKRKEPIPLYGELGSINPQVVLSEKLEQSASELAEQLCQSLLMGNGQFCTSPGLWLIPTQSNEFLKATKEFIESQGSDTLLTPGIQNSYRSAVDSLKLNQQLIHLAQSKRERDFHGEANIFVTDVATFAENQQLQQEVFGPSAIIVTYQSEQQLVELLASLDGQLTATVHGTESDIQSAEQVTEILSHKVGRLIFNQMPTGVEICRTMNHGGPFPASTDVRTTSVGLEAMTRFLRPLCIQNRI